MRENNYADTKVSEEGGRGGMELQVPGQRFPCSPC